MFSFVPRRLAAALVLPAVGGCAHYTALPLDASAHYAPSITALRGTPATGDVLSTDDVTRLILANSPALQLAGERRAEARSLAEAGSRPPNPSFGGSLGYLLSGAGNATAWTAALSQPVNGWITLRARRREAQASIREVDATLAWEAWQAVAKGRLLVTDIQMNQQLLTAQREMSSLLREQRDVLLAARARGDVDAATTMPVAQAASEAEQAEAESERALVGQQRELRALMGLAFDATLPLAPLPRITPLDEQVARRAIDEMAVHRPDLVALAMGYEAEDARFRAAVLTQFPTLAIGYDASQDNSRVTNGGPSLTMDLPLFDRGRAQADAADATRQRLHDEYGQRVADARDEARALIAAGRVAEAQLARMGYANGSEEPARGPARALGRYDLDRSAYTDLAAAALARRVALLRTELAVREQRIALDTLLGTGMPVIEPARGAP
jgi:outer membrane protein TolC